MACNDVERRIKLKYNYIITCDWKAELKLTPAEREQALRAPHSKVDIGRHWAGQVNIAFELLPIAALNRKAPFIKEEICITQEKVKRCS